MVWYMFSEWIPNILFGKHFCFSNRLLSTFQFIDSNDHNFFLQSESKVEKLTKRHATVHDLAGSIVPKRQRLGTVSKNQSSIASTSSEVNNFEITFECAVCTWNEWSNKENMFAQFQIEAVDNICQGLEFNIVNGEKNSHSVEELKNMVRRHGGKVVFYPSNFIFHSISLNLLI